MQTLLIGDIGGTNARFALVDEASGEFHSAESLQCADFQTAEAAVSAYLASKNVSNPEVICLAAAGPLINGEINVTNNHWTISQQSLGDQFSSCVVRLMNDFEAVAHCIPHLHADDCLPIGSSRPHHLSGDFSVAVIGPGTGLGAAGLRQQDGNSMPIIGEGGHAAFAPKTPLQIEVLRDLMQRYSSVSIERLISGPGIENIYSVLATRNGVSPVLSASEIFKTAVAEPDSVAAETTQLFFEILGQASADLALTLGAVDGLYIAGGITKRYDDLLLGSRFRAAFENVGKFDALMATVPTYLIMHDEPGLYGAAHCALNSLAYFK